MKKRVTMILFAAVFFASAAVFARPSKQAKVISPEQIFVKLTATNAPRYNHDLQKNEKPSPNKWIQIHINYTFNSALKFRENATYDNMRCEVYLRTIPSSGGWKGGYWLTGTQFFYSVIPDHLWHSVTMFVPPPLVYRLSVYGSSPSALVKQCLGVVIFYNGEKELGRRYFHAGIKGDKMDSKQKQAVQASFSKMNDRPENKFVNGIWPKEKTPWQWLYSNSHDLPKPGFDTASSAKMQRADASEDKNEEEDDESEKADSGQDDKEDSDSGTSGVQFKRSSDNAKNKNRSKK